MDISDFFKSISRMRLGEKHQAQNEYVNALLVQVTLDQTDINIESSKCNSELEQHDFHLSNGDRFHLEQLVKLYSLISKLLVEIKAGAERNWSRASGQSFNQRLSILEQLWEDYNDIAEVKQKGMELVTERWKSNIELIQDETHGTDTSKAKEEEQ